MATIRPCAAGDAEIRPRTRPRHSRPAVAPQIEDERPSGGPATADPTDDVELASQDRGACSRARLGCRGKLSPAAVAKHVGLAPRRARPVEAADHIERLPGRCARCARDRLGKVGISTPPLRPGEERMRDPGGSTAHEPPAVGCRPGVERGHRATPGEDDPAVDGARHRAGEVEGDPRPPLPAGTLARTPGRTSVGRAPRDLVRLSSYGVVRLGIDVDAEDGERRPRDLEPVAPEPSPRDGGPAGLGQLPDRGRAGVVHGRYQSGAVDSPYPKDGDEPVRDGLEIDEGAAGHREYRHRARASVDRRAETDVARRVRVSGED